MSNAVLIAGAGITRHGDQQYQSSQCAFQHYSHSLGTRSPKPNAQGNPGFPADVRPKGHARGAGALKCHVLPIRHDGQNISSTIQK
jgi:hypothetical protein